MELKPCPCCGSEDIRHAMGKHQTGGFWESVECYDCSLEADSPEKWNRRAPRPYVIDRLPETREEVVALVRVLYPEAEWIVWDGEYAETGKGRRPVWRPTLSSWYFYPGGATIAFIPWAAHAFRDIAPEDSLTEVRE